MMRGLFTLLFGASMLLVIDHGRIRCNDPVTVYSSRMAGFGAGQ